MGLGRCGGRGAVLTQGTLRVFWDNVYWTRGGQVAQRGWIEKLELSLLKSASGIRYHRLYLSTQQKLEVSTVHR